MREHLPGLLRALAALHLVIAVLNLCLARLLGWRAAIEGLPPLVREVHRVHAFFLSVTLTLFGVLSWRFADEMAAAASPLAVWLAAGIGVFWALRAALQVVYYSPAHWRGQPRLTLLHAVLLATYAGMGAVYLYAAAG